MPSVSKTYSFSAAHELDLPYLSDCNALHGHNYSVEVEVTGLLNEHNIIVDFNDLDKLVDPIIDRLDHSFLNEELGSARATTSEALAKRIWTELYAKLDPYTVRVTVSETPKTKAVWP